MATTNKKIFFLGTSPRNQEKVGQQSGEKGEGTQKKSWEAIGQRTKPEGGKKNVYPKNEALQLRELQHIRVLRKGGG